MGGICLCENDNENWKGSVIHILQHVAVFTTENNYRKCWYKSLGMIAMKNHFKEHGRDNGRKLVRFWSWWNHNGRDIPILKWRHNRHDDVSSHQPHHCLLNYYFSADQRKHQNSTSLAFVWGIHRGPVNSPHKWPVTREVFPFDDVIMKSTVSQGWGLLNLLNFIGSSKSL